MPRTPERSSSRLRCGAPSLRLRDDSEDQPPLDREPLPLRLAVEPLLRRVDATVDVFGDAVGRSGGTVPDQNEVRPLAPAHDIEMWTWSRCGLAPEYGRQPSDAR